MADVLETVGNAEPPRIPLIEKYWCRLVHESSVYIEIFGESAQIFSYTAWEYPLVINSESYALLHIQNFVRSLARAANVVPSSSPFIH